MDRQGRWQIVFYRDAKGKEPVREWIEELEKKASGEYGRVRHKLRRERSLEQRS